MEIPEYLNVLIFAVVASFVVYALEPGPINMISAPMSNFTNITRSIPYTVIQADNITKTIYFYGSITNMSKHTGISKEYIIKELMASKVFITNCTGIPEKKFGDPYNYNIICTFFGERFWTS